MALSKFTSHSLRNVFLAKGLTSAQHTLCFTQRISNSHIVTQSSRQLGAPLFNSHPLIAARTFASAKKTEAEESHIDEAAVISSYRVAPETVEKLKAKGITSFFPIQYETYDLIYDGYDLVGRARTGTGKTLSFALPILEKIKAQGQRSSRQRGRRPLVLIMSPTRELAKQIANEIEGLSDLSVVTLYGGTPTQPQEMELRHGVDVVVGTPGRIQDLLERGSLTFDDIKYVILDEADEMLKIGFQDALDMILGHVPKDEVVQRLLFSATIPKWVSQIADKTLKRNHKVVDLIGDEVVKSSETITHYAIECSNQHQLETLADVVRVYSKGGNTLIFAPTKNAASEISTSSSIQSMCQVLHGDISQDQREITLNAFKKGKFTVLVATDVAARGLDIPQIDLVINCQPPEAPETYIHRVGRTGRAGKAGIAITFYNRRTHENLRGIESHVGIKMTRIGTPQLSEIVKAVYTKGKNVIEKVDKNLVDAFSSNAKTLIEESGGDATKVLAAALAHISGYNTAHKKRSLLTGSEGFSTLLFNMKVPATSTSLVMDYLRNYATGVREPRITLDGSVVVDVPEEDAAKLAGSKVPSRYEKITSVEIPTTLPELTDAPTMGRSSYSTKGRDAPRGGYSKFGRDKESYGGGGYKKDFKERSYNERSGGFKDGAYKNKFKSESYRGAKRSNKFDIYE